jgi:LL-H family phage holin
MEFFSTELISFLTVVVAGCVGIVTKAGMSYLKNKGVVAKITSNKELASIVVNAVEQTYTALHGEEKLNLAKIELVKLAKEKGLKITEKELDLLIESSVKEMKKAIKENK